MIDRGFEFSILVGTNKANASGFSVDLTADKAGCSILAVFVDRGGFD
jgi:hypothetical protein